MFEGLTVATANPARVKQVMDRLARAFEEICANPPDNEDLTYVDAMMGVHNFHKLIIFDLVDRHHLQGAELRIFLSAAKATWNKAIDEELRRTLD